MAQIIINIFLAHLYVLVMAFWVDYLYLGFLCELPGEGLLFLQQVEAEAKTAEQAYKMGDIGNAWDADAQCT